MITEYNDKCQIITRRSKAKIMNQSYLVITRYQLSFYVFDLCSFATVVLLVYYTHYYIIVIDNIVNGSMCYIVCNMYQQIAIVYY